MNKYSYIGEPRWDLCHSYCIVPYSFITQTEPDPEERKILFGLYKQLDSRGYRYSTDPDRMDFIATVRISSHVDSTEYPHVSFFAPSIDKVAPYLPDDTDTVRVTGPLRRVGAELELFIYDAKNYHCVGQFLGATIDSDVNYLAATEDMLPILVQWRLPRNMDGRSLDTLFGLGMAGFNFDIENDDSHALFPKINYIVPNSAAQKSNICVGDFIIGINGESTKNFDRTTVLERMKGDVGRRVALTIKHINNIVEDTLVYGPRPKGN